MEKQEFINKILKNHGIIKYDYSLVPNNIKSIDKIDIICPIHGKFKQQVNSHIINNKCPKCSKIKDSLKIKIKNEEFISRCKKIHQNPDGTPKYDYSITNYTHSENFIKYICPIHGIQEQKASVHLRGHGCKECGLNSMLNKNRLSNEEFISRCKKIHQNPDGTPKYDYSITNYINTSYTIKYICPIHGIQEQFADSHLRGHGCKKCAIQKLSLSNEEFISRCKKIHQNPDGTPKYDYLKTIFTKSLDIITITCPIHGDFNQLATNHLHNKEGCPYCSHHISNAELEIQKFLNQNNILFNSNTRIIIYPKELDIYIPDKNLAIEFDGLNFHSETYKSNNYHLKKTEDCEKQRIQLIHIFEDEWIEKQDIVKSRLLNILGKNKWKIGARKCVIKQVTPEEERLFLENNHLQGYVASQICYGLYYTHKSNNSLTHQQVEKEYLVSLMSFGGLRRNLGSSQEKDVYELYRFVNAKNFTIIGGASKLFKHFVNKFKPKQIISFADRRWSIKSLKNLYEQLGFEFNSYTKPGYFYIQGNKRVNRFGLRKDILVSKYGCPKELSEHEFCEQQGWFRIYDCGQLKYIWKSNNVN